MPINGLIGIGHQPTTIATVENQVVNPTYRLRKGNTTPTFTINRSVLVDDCISDDARWMNELQRHSTVEQEDWILHCYTHVDDVALFEQFQCSHVVGEFDR